MDSEELLREAEDAWRHYVDLLPSDTPSDSANARAWKAGYMLGRQEGWRAGRIALLEGHPLP